MFDAVCKNGLEVISIEEEKCEKVCKKEIEEECETVKVIASHSWDCNPLINSQIVLCVFYTYEYV